MKTLLIALTASLAAPAANAARLSMEEYLRQVSARSPGMAAARLSGEGYARRAESASVLSAPYLFGSLGGYKDQSETAFPLQQGSESKGTAYTFGVGMNTTLGLNGKYSWNTSYAETTGIPLPTAGRYTSFNKLELTMNLVRNGFGSELRARKELIASGNSAQSLGGKFEQLSRTAEAESAYWRLAAARQSVQIQKDVLGRAEQLLDWARKRVKNQLGDRADVLQAQASRDLHSLSLATAEEEERKSARAFNLLRAEEGERVPESVNLPSLDETLKLTAPKRSGTRLSLQAAEARAKAAQAQIQIDREALKPSVDLSASYAWNGREAERSPAISEAWGNRHPSRSIGLVFSVPLNVPTWSHAIGGAGQALEASAFELEQARLGDEVSWQDLSQRLTIARTRLGLARTLERVQKEKAEHEGRRLLRGRTTTFQALSFEQDYAQAQLLRLQTQSEVLGILAQMRTYRGDL